jgi:hypothetical protein
MITFTPEYWSMSLYTGGAENIVKDKGGLIHGGAYTGKGLYTEFYGKKTMCDRS